MKKKILVTIGCVVGIGGITANAIITHRRIKDLREDVEFLSEYTRRQARILGKLTDYIKTVDEYSEILNKKINTVIPTNNEE